MAEEVKIEAKRVDNGLSGPIRVLDFSKFKDITNSVYLSDNELSEVATLLEKDWSIAFLEQLVLLYTYEYIMDKYYNKTPIILLSNSSSYPNIYSFGYNGPLDDAFKDLTKHLSKDIIIKLKEIKNSTVQRFTNTKLIKLVSNNQNVRTYNLTTLGSNVVKEFLQLQNSDNRLLFKILEKVKE